MIAMFFVLLRFSGSTPEEGYYYRNSTYLYLPLFFRSTKDCVANSTANALCCGLFYIKFVAATFNINIAIPVYHGHINGVVWDHGRWIELTSTHACIK